MIKKILVIGLVAVLCIGGAVAMFSNTNIDDTNTSVDVSNDTNNDTIINQSNNNNNTDNVNKSSNVEDNILPLEEGVLLNILDENNESYSTELNITQNETVNSTEDNNTTEQNNTEKQEDKHNSLGSVHSVFICNECGGFITNIAKNFDLGFKHGVDKEIDSCVHYNCSLNLDLFTIPILDFYHGWFVSDDAYDSFIYKSTHSLKDNSTSLENKTLQDIDWEKWNLLSQNVDNSSNTGDVVNDSLNNNNEVINDSSSEVNTSNMMD